MAVLKVPKDFLISIAWPKFSSGITGEGSETGQQRKITPDCLADVPVVFWLRSLEI